MTAGRLGVGVVGAGRVGPVLAAALAGAGHAVTAVTSGSDDDRVEALLPGVPRLTADRVVERSELVLLTVPDDELPGLVAGLAATGAFVAGQLVLHTAPGLGTGVLAPATAAGAIPLALSWACAFTGTSIDLVRLRECWCAVTAPAPVLPIGQALAVETGAEPIVIAERDRPDWAAALAAVTLPLGAAVARGSALLAGIGVEEPERVLGPVGRSALERALGRRRPVVVRPAAERTEEDG